MDTKPDFSEIIIYTSTLYEDDETANVRSQLCLNMLKNAENIGIKVVIKDGGSNEKFIAELQKFNNVTLINDAVNTKYKSMGSDRRAALNAALEISEKEKMEHPCFLWTEPEKDNLISRENLSRMASEIKRGANIVVPARKEKAMETLPEGQKWFEQRANKRALEIIKETLKGRHQEQLDLWFGPKMFDRDTAKYFTDYNKEGNRNDQWETINIPVVEAIRDGKNVASVPVDYEYDESQKNNESRELKDLFMRKRLEQYAQILKEMGDKKWTEFFKEADDELKKINELNREKDINSENKKLLDEAKINVNKKFFK